MTSHEQVTQWLDQNEKLFTDMADEIWAKPELQFQEFFASKLQADFLEEAGFKITWDIGGMNTAFMAAEVPIISPKFSLLFNVSCK